jgi:hypothetical protein
MELQPYPFAEWPDAWLRDRFGVLSESIHLPHGEERLATVGREMAHLVLELEWRDTDRALEAAAAQPVEQPEPSRGGRLSRRR